MLNFSVRLGDHCVDGSESVSLQPVAKNSRDYLHFVGLGLHIVALRCYGRSVDRFRRWYARWTTAL